MNEYELINTNWNLLVAAALAAVAVFVLSLMFIASLFQGGGKRETWNNYDVKKAADFHRNDRGIKDNLMLSAKHVPDGKLFMGIDVNAKPVDTIYYPDGKVKRYAE